MDFRQGNQKSTPTDSSVLPNTGEELVVTSMLTPDHSINGNPQWDNPKASRDAKVVDAERCGKAAKQPTALPSTRRSPHKAGKTHSRQLKDSPVKSPSKSPIKLKDMMQRRGREFGADIVLPSFASDGLIDRPNIEEIVLNLQNGRDTLFSSSSGEPQIERATIKNSRNTQARSGSSKSPEKAKWCPPTPLFGSSDDTDSLKDHSVSRSVELMLSSFDPKCRNGPCRPKAPKRVASWSNTSVNAQNSSSSSSRLSTCRSLDHDVSRLHMSLDMCCLNEVGFLDDDPDFDTLLEEQENEMIRLAMKNSMESVGYISSDHMSCRAGDDTASSLDAGAIRGEVGGQNQKASGDCVVRKRLSMIDLPVAGDFGHENGTTHTANSRDDKQVREDLVDNTSGVSLQLSSAVAPSYSVRDRALAEMKKQLTDFYYT